MWSVCSEMLFRWEYYAALKRKEILIHAVSWMNLEDITLNEINWSLKDKYYMIPLNMKSLEQSDSDTENRMVGDGAGGGWWGARV